MENERKTEKDKYPKEVEKSQQKDLVDTDTPSGGKSPVICKFCGKDFSFKSHLARHMTVHTGEKSFRCHICGKGLSRMTHLVNHMVTHTGEKSFRCADCGKAFGFKHDLSRHMVTHTGEKNFRCTICQREFSLSSTLKRHMITHSGERKFACKICGKAFKQKNQKREHMSVHNENRHFKCKICGQVFLGKSNLIEHKLTHANEPKYWCNICGKGFTQRSSLSHHMLSHAEGGKKFVCSKCLRGFSQRADFTRHMVAHSGGKLFKCGLCAKEFFRKSDATKHINRKHSDSDDVSLETILVPVDKEELVLEPLRFREEKSDAKNESSITKTTEDSVIVKRERFDSEDESSSRKVNTDIGKVKKEVDDSEGSLNVHVTAEPLRINKSESEDEDYSTSSEDSEDEDFRLESEIDKLNPTVYIKEEPPEPPAEEPSIEQRHLGDPHVFPSSSLYLADGRGVTTNITTPHFPKSTGCYCSAYGCSNNRQDYPDKSFFRFPKDKDRCQIWVHRSRREDLQGKDVSYIYNNCRLCVDHFDEAMFMNSAKNKLVWDAVPKPISAIAATTSRKPS